MKLFVGLGNPGKQYAYTRHNMGYEAIDRFAEMAGGIFDKTGFKGVYGIIKNPELKETIIVCKPETFMNLSGECVRPLADYYKISVEDIVVVYDEMALPEGQIRLRESGSSAGHKGIENIIQHFGTKDIKRIRIGIGEPGKHDPVNFVLGKPSQESFAKIERALDDAALALRDTAMKSFAQAMNIYNGKRG